MVGTKRVCTRAHTSARTAPVIVPAEQLYRRHQGDEPHMDGSKGDLSADSSFFN